MRRPQFLAFNGFVAVLTPHFLTQWDERANLRVGASLTPDYIWALWSAAPDITVCAVAFGSGYIYARKAYNSWRGRWELEFISFTPNKHIQTLNNKSARLIKLA
jgi:hypothetical protein